MAVLTVPITLVQAAKQGDKVAFMSLLEPSLEPGYRMACGMLHDSQAAEDAVQEAAFKVWRKLGQLREGHELRPWFLGIVANECRTVRRSRWRSVLKWPKSEHPVETSPGLGPERNRASTGIATAGFEQTHGARSSLVPRSSVGRDFSHHRHQRACR